jgi:hypothetical protein
MVRSSYTGIPEGMLRHEYTVSIAPAAFSESSCPRRRSGPPRSARYNACTATYHIRMHHNRHHRVSVVRRPFV